MAFQPVRFKVKQVGWGSKRPLFGYLAVVVPGFFARINAGILRLPQGRLRRQLLDYFVREWMAGTFDRRDYRLVPYFLAEDFRGTAAPEIAPLVGQETDHRLDRSTIVQFVEEWRSAWGEIIVTPQEVVDLGDRLIILSHITSRGAGSGLQIDHPNEAELYEFKGGRISVWRQFWSWDEALAAAGLSE